jgi:hypothetical protein
MKPKASSDRINKMNGIPHPREPHLVNLVNPVPLGNESRQQYLDIPVGSNCATCSLALDLPGTRAEFPNQPVEATATRPMRFGVRAGDRLGGSGRRASPFRSEEGCR